MYRKYNHLLFRFFRLGPVIPGGTCGLVIMRERSSHLTRWHSIMSAERVPTSGAGSSARVGATGLPRKGLWFGHLSVAFNVAVFLQNRLSRDCSNSSPITFARGSDEGSTEKQLSIFMLINVRSPKIMEGKQFLLANSFNKTPTTCCTTKKIVYVACIQWQKTTQTKERTLCILVIGAQSIQTGLTTKPKYISLFKQS